VKEIKAVIQPARLARLRDIFRAMPDFPGMTVTRAEGSGYHPDKPAMRGVKSELTDYSAKVRLEILAPEEQIAFIVQAIHDAAHTGQPGDGIVWVSAVEKFQRLRLPVDP
jgi:nitrogen regulatory protein P-II 1